MHILIQLEIQMDSVSNTSHAGGIMMKTPKILMALVYIVMTLFHFSAHSKRILDLLLDEIVNT